MPTVPLIRLQRAVIHRCPLRPLDWTVDPGRHWVVTGPRGSGKTSLAEAVVGRRRTLSGSIRYPFLDASSSYAARRAPGYTADLP